MKVGDVNKTQRGGLASRLEAQERQICTVMPVGLSKEKPNRSLWLQALLETCGCGETVLEGPGARGQKHAIPCDFAWQSHPLTEDYLPRRTSLTTRYP